MANAIEITRDFTASRGRSIFLHAIRKTDIFEVSLELGKVDQPRRWFVLFNGIHWGGAWAMIKRVARLAAVMLLSTPILAQEHTPALQVTTDPKNNVRVLTQSHSYLIPPGPDQVGIDSVEVSEAGRTAGWLVLYRNPDGGAPFAGK